jgi:hypothetical protein
MKSHLLLALFCAMFAFSSCSENYSNGERIGFVSKMSQKGVFWKSWEGHLNMTQTGMNTADSFDFSVDNDNEPAGLVALLDSAAQYGWKVELKYHETVGKNWFGNRGGTDHFVTECRVLDKTPLSFLGKGVPDSTQNKVIGGVVRDTIYVVIRRDK